jgi:aryl-alcohol dehydrogenase-like predicted oxidoreductase
MQYNTLGKTDLKVSRLCLGCMTFGEPDRGNHAWTLPEESSRLIIQHALNGGINFFDTANSYSDGSSEEIVGRALRDFARREDVVVATKVYHASGTLKEGLSRAQILRSIDDSLQRLGMDYVDLLQIHRWDYNTPIEETLEALNDVVKAGKARYIGASSMHAHQFAQALELQKQHGWAPFVTMQDHYNLIYREEEREMLPLCYKEGAVIPWSPLARGRLTRPWGETTARIVSDEVGKNSTTKAMRTTRRLLSVWAPLPKKRRYARAGRAGMAAEQTRYCRPDYRRIARRATRRAITGGRFNAKTRADRRNGNTVQTASGGRV